MTQRLYIIPIVHLPLDTGGFYNVPQYFQHRLNPALPGMEGAPWAWTTYLNEDVGIILSDTTDAQNTLLDSQPGVFPISSLDDTIPNANVRNRVRNALEATFVPGTWINTGMVYRDILRAVAGMFDYHNRVVAVSQGRMFTSGVTLSTTVSQLTSEKQAVLQQVAQELGLDYSGVSGSTALRDVLLLANNIFNASRPYEIRGAGMSMII